MGAVFVSFGFAAGASTTGVSSAATGTVSAFASSAATTFSVTGEAGALTGAGFFLVFVFLGLAVIIITPQGVFYNSITNKFVFVKYTDTNSFRNSVT